MKRATKSDLGKACEFFVRADLLARGLKVTYPDNVNGNHDVHVRVGQAWYTVQVESAQLTPTNALHSRKAKRKVFSDVLALVHIPSQRIRYLANRLTVPAELQADLTILYVGGACQSSSSNVAAVKK